ncbi:MAG: adenosylcobinamide-GDP ribazoletransferase [Lentihominibacter sp.]
MKYIRGFLMAWGMFCWIPCPYRKWDGDARNAQLAMLPLVGTGMGIICCLIWRLLAVMGAGSVITGAVLTGAYFLMTGFIHLDGFMDCSDAVMPRHPEMEQRQRILKDSSVGAFAAAALGLMLLIFASSWITMAGSLSIGTCGIVIMIFTLSRTTAALNVMMCRPMKTSQYAAAGKKDNGVEITVAILIGAFVTVAAMIGSGWEHLQTSPLGGAMCALAAAVVTAGSGLLTGIYDRKKLGGMNGDISGHMITLSEMFGIMTLALLI